MSGRRRLPRIAVTRDFYGRAVGVRVRLAVREISREGFSVAAELPFPVGSEERFTFRGPEGPKVEVHACCVHVQPPIPAPGPAQYIAGFAVLGHSKADLQRLVSSLERHALRERKEELVGSSLAPTAGGAGVSRRRSSRFEVTGSVDVAIAGSAAPVRLRDVGLGGFAVESRAVFPTGQCYSVHFTSPHGLDARLTARSVHSRPVQGPSGERLWLTGFAYMANSVSSDDAIESVLDQATSSLSFL